MNGVNELLATVAPEEVIFALFTDLKDRCARYFRAFYANFSSIVFDEGRKCIGTAVCYDDRYENQLEE